MKPTQSHRRQSAPSLVLSKALTRSRTVAVPRDSFLGPVFPETLPLVQSFLGPDRAFLLHGHAQLKTGLQTQDRHLFLFTDLLIVAKSKSPSNFKLKTQACVCEMWIAGCMEEVCEGSTNPDLCFVMGWPTYNCVATFSSTIQKERWLSLLKRRIKEEKENKEPKTIPLKVLGKDIGSVAPTKTIPVSNSDSTNEVVRLALQQFGIAGHVKDYQLWVISKRDNAPYPLIGHECPFSIHMSHVREPLSHRDTVTTPDKQRALHPAEKPLPEKECQFILKPRCITAQQPVIDPAQKAFRRRSLINWAFWRGSNSHLHDPAFSSPATGCLFGQPLSAVCRDVTLPKPVMDMLVFLYHEGAFTRGIFRRSAGAKACRELRDTLDAGAREIPLIREHVFIIAGVFKDFLRNIPGSLLCCDLYEQWMSVMGEEEEEEAKHARAIQRLIGQLPIEHSLLLRYVVAMLHGIQGNADDNQMNAFNLSVCIAPSMLWAPGPSSPAVEGEGAKKVCDLVCFMIEHCQEVLGADVTSLFGGPPLWGRFSEQRSDGSSIHLTDSSYDSLENELNEDVSGSPGLRARRGHCRVKPRQRSLDSVLTLSDYEENQTDIHIDINIVRTPVTQPGNPKQQQQHHLLSPSSAQPTSRRPPSADAASSRPPTQDRCLSASPDPLAMGGTRTQRRSSEPAMCHGGLTLNRDPTCDRDHARVGGNRELRGSLETLSDECEEEDAYVGGLQPAGPPCTQTGLRGQLLLHVASYSSLSSGGRTRSSADSLDSLLSDHTAQTWHLGTAKGPCSCSLPAAPLHSPTSAPPSVSSLTPSPAPVPTPSPAPVPGPVRGLCLKSSPPKEAFSWGALKCGRGLHPSSWLKKARRLSLQKPEEREEERKNKSGERGAGVRRTSADPPTSSSAYKSRGPERGKVAQDPGPQLLRQKTPEPPFLRQTHYCRSPCHQPTVRVLREAHSHASLLPHHGNTGSDVINQGQATGRDAASESKCPPWDVFHDDEGPCLSLDRHKSHSLTPPTEGCQGRRLSQRRSSAPGAPCLDEALALNRASVLHLQRFHREAKLTRKIKDDRELTVSAVEHRQKSGEARFCLSPSFTKAVRDYFSSHRGGNPQSSQQVALALVQGKKHWQRRCSDPVLEPDFDQLYSGGESFV